MLTTKPLRVDIGIRVEEHIAIEVLDYVQDGWRRARVEVACGVWRGEFAWQFYNGELRRFAKEIQRLYEELKGEAKLDPMEPNLRLLMTGDGKGHLTVTGCAEADFYTGCYLTFRLSLDQTELPAIVSALSDVDPR